MFMIQQRFVCIWKHSGFYENIPVPLQGMNADNYEIYVMYQDGFYDTQQTFAIN